MAQIAVRLQAIKFGGFDQAVEVGAGLGTVDGIGKNPVVPTHHEGANGTFRGIVVDVQPTVFTVDGERGPLLAQISQGFADQAGRCDLS